MKKNEIFTIPNILSFYRLLAFPIILYFIISGKEALFAIFLVINLVTDAADGFIARRFNMETDFGAKLDSMADNFTYILAYAGIYVFKLEEFLPHKISLFIYIGMCLLTIILSLIKFGKFPSFHLYMTKINGYIQFVFIVCLFTVGFITPIYYLTIGWGILGAVEHIAIQLVISEYRSNVKGLYWVLKERKNAIQKQQSI